MAAVVANQPVQPMRFGGGVAGASNVTLTISPAQSSQVSSGAGGNNFYKRQGGYRFQQPINMANDIMMMGDGPGRRLRKNVANVRRHVDYVATVLNHADARLWQYKRRQRPVQQPDELYQNTALPARCTPDVPVDCVLTKFVRAAMNKVKCPVYSLCWTPEGKRLITGASTGEFTLWNGTAFNFETILQAHDSAIRAMTWSYNEQWLVSADHDGFIKYWQPNMNNVHMYQAHKDEPIRALSFAPTDLKLASASDDGTGRIWDFARCVEERVLRGHGSEVRCIDWHPNKGLVVTGSRDSQQPVKLWDPKTAQCLSTLQDHKSSVMAVEWNRNGNWLLTAGRDHLIKLYDIRIMKEMHTFRGHKKEVTAVAWHPVHEGLFVSGGGDGSLAYWLIDSEKEVGLLEHAHDQAVWAMRWHPMGHILATGSNDNNTKFWARNRPGDTQEDIFGLASFTTNMVGALDKEREPKNINIRYEEDFSVSIIPGMGLDDDVVEKMNREISTGVTASNATMLLMPEDLNARQQAANIGAKRTLIKQPPPKKAQRQFERMWNVSKPGASGDDVGLDDEEAFQRPKPSLLGKAPPSMLSNSGLVAPGISPSGGKLMGGPPGFTGGRLTGPSALSGMPPGWQSQGQPSPSRGPPQQTQQPQRGQNLGPYNQQPATSRSMSSSQLPSSGGNTQLSTLNRPNPPQMPPGPIPPGFPFSALPPGMSPAMLAGLWPPGMMLTPGIPPQMASKSDVTLAGGGDIDYRVGTGAAQSSGSGDVDLRAQTSSLPRSSTQPQVPSSNDSWRAQDNSCSSAKNTMHDPRMRKQDDVMRDPRRRQPQESEQSNKQTRNTTSMENRRNWMPQISEYSSQNDQNGQQSYGYGNQPSQSEGYSGQETYDVDGYGNGYGSHDSGQDYDSGYCEQGQGYDRRRNHSGHGQSGNRYINQGYGGPDYSGGGPMRGGRSRGRGRGRPY